jgi:hypothetical protein
LALAAALLGGAAPLNSATSDYVEHCGGCHGIQGTSYPARVPTLRGRAGLFLCTEQARAYLLRLPNVALSATDDNQLAAIMNFVAFDLGRAEGVMAKPFTAAEVAAERRHPLSTAALTVERARVVRGIAARCHVRPAQLDF